MAIKNKLKTQFSDFLKANKDVALALNRAVDGLDANLTPMQIEDVLHDFDLTARDVGLITMAIAKFHGRGDEFRAYWIKRNNAETDRDFEKVPIGFPITKRKA